MKKTNESGRSMVEMLGVLAIIGVLSVGGIAGYTTAMNKHRANQILNGASVRAIVVSTQIQRGSNAPTLGEFTDNEVGGARFGTGVQNADGTAAWATTDKRFSLTLTGVNEDICTQMKAMVGSNSIIREINEGCTTITYNNDLTATTFITDNKDSTSCESAGGAWNDATKTCGCPGRYTGSNCEIAPTSCPSGTTLTEDGKCKYCNKYDENQCMECEMGDEILDSGYYVLVAECYNPKTESAKCGYTSGSVDCLKCSKPETPYMGGDTGSACYNPETQNINCSRYTCKTCEKNSDTPDVFCTENACTCYNSKTQNYGCSYYMCITCTKPNIPLFNTYGERYTCYNPETTSAACSRVECKICNKPEEAKCSEGGYCTCYNPQTQNVICTEYICKACDRDSDTPQPYCDDEEMKCSCRAE